MLKIKDNVDLKELEKYGFEYEKGYEWQGYKAYKLKSDDCIIVVVDDEDRWLAIKLYERIMAVIPSVLYDLIQAGLIEKVKE